MIPMRPVAKLLALLSLTAATIACDSAGAEYVKQMETSADKVCACKDLDCTAKASKEQADWLAKNAEAATKLSADDAKKVADAGTKMGACMTKLATSAAGAAEK